MSNEILNIYRNRSGKVIYEFRGGDAPHISEGGWKDTLNDIRQSSAKYIRIDKNVAYFGYEGITLKLNNFMDLLQDEELVRYLSPSVLKTLHKRILTLEQRVAEKIKAEDIKKQRQGDNKNIHFDNSINNMTLVKTSPSNEQLKHYKNQGKLKCTRKNKHVSLKTKVVVGALVLALAATGVTLAITSKSQNQKLEPVKENITRQVPAEGMLAIQDEQHFTDYILPEGLRINSDFTLPGLDLNIDEFDQTRLEKVIPYEDRSQSLEIANVMDNYEEVIRDYSERCGIDPRIMYAVAAQESAGDHEHGLSNGSMGGLFQVEMSTWKNKTISYYDLKDKQDKEILINDEFIKDPKNCTEAACALMQDALNRYRSIPLAIQEYNMGYRNLSSVLQGASQDLRMTIPELYKDETCPWKNYTFIAKSGDKGYLDKVLSFAGFGYGIEELTCTLTNGQAITCNSNSMFKTSQQIEETSKSM